MLNNLLDPHTTGPLNFSRGYASRIHQGDYGRVALDVVRARRAVNLETHDHGTRSCRVPNWTHLPEEIECSAALVGGMVKGAGERCGCSGEEEAPMLSMIEVSLMR